MKNKQPAIFAVLATVVIDIIMLLIPHTNTLAFWIAFTTLTLSGLLFLVPMLVKPPSDYTTRVPIFAALGVNYVIQIVLTFVSNTGLWRLTVIVALPLFLALAAVALLTSLSEQKNDEANARLEQESANRFVPKQGGF